MFEMPARWDPRKVAVNRDKENPFLLRPGQLLVGPGDEKDAQAVLTGWRMQDRKTFGVTTFTRQPQNPEDPAAEVLETIARLRKATVNRAQGPVRVAPNHVLVGEKAITLTGEPRLQGGPGSSVRLAKLPKSMPLRTTRRGDGKGVKIAVLDTGLFDHQWLTAVQRAAGSADIWDVEPDQSAGHEPAGAAAGLPARGPGRRAAALALACSSPSAEREASVRVRHVRRLGDPDEASRRGCCVRTGVRGSRTSVGCPGTAVHMTLRSSERAFSVAAAAITTSSSAVARAALPIVVGVGRGVSALTEQT